MYRCNTIRPVNSLLHDESVSEFFIVVLRQVQFESNF
jgi:hypothetical protein